MMIMTVMTKVRFIDDGGDGDSDDEATSSELAKLLNMTEVTSLVKVRLVDGETPRDPMADEVAMARKTPMVWVSFQNLFLHWRISPLPATTGGRVVYDDVLDWQPKKQLFLRQSFNSDEPAITEVSSHHAVEEHSRLKLAVQG
ncbi:hypothetical protein U1Q18_008989 [Sarracenia purpurea var. burkii]